MSGKLWLFASDNIGTASNPIATRTGNIKGKATTGDIFIDNTGAVAVGGVTGGAAGAAPAGIQAGGSVLFGAHSPVTISQDILAKDQIVVISRDSADNTADFVRINAGVELATSAAAGIPLAALNAGQVVLCERRRPRTRFSCSMPPAATSSPWARLPTVPRCII